MHHISKVLVSCLISCLLMFNVASAQPPEGELNEYLAEIGWTKQELLEYLEFYEIPLETFSSVEELKWVLGTPITPENFQDLLTMYNLTDQELYDLFSHFGDSVDEYMFIEDLDAATDFYVNHDEYMGDIETDLSEIGITEEETERFFQYLTEVEEKNKHYLDQMELIDSRLEDFLYVSDTSELSDEQIDELAQILTESITMYEIKVQFKVDNQEVTLNELLKMEEAPSNLYLSISTIAGEPLIDFTVPIEFFETAEVIDEGEDMIHVGELADEFIDDLHEEKYEDLENIEK